MTYRIVHKTIYTYQHPVSSGTHIAYLTPRSKPHHTCTSHELFVTPLPVEMRERTDYFGNSFAFFTIQEPHQELKIEAHSRVVVDGASVKWPGHSPAWDEVVRSLPADHSAVGLDAYQFVFESPRVPVGPQFAAYAAPSFSPGRALAEGLLDLTSRIYWDFRFDSKATDVRTSPAEVLRSRRVSVSGFRSPRSCMLAIVRSARQVRQRLYTDLPAAWKAQADRRRRFARVDFRVLSRRGMAGCGSH